MATWAKEEIELKDSSQFTLNDYDAEGIVKNLIVRTCRNLGEMV